MSVMTSIHLFMSCYLSASEKGHVGVINSKLSIMNIFIHRLFLNLRNNFRFLMNFSRMADRILALRKRRHDEWPLEIAMHPNETNNNDLSMVNNLKFW